LIDPVRIALGTLGLGTHLFIKIPRPGDSGRPLRSSSQVAICSYQSDHFKVEAIPFAQGHNKRTCWPICTLSLFYAERQAEKL